MKEIICMEDEIKKGFAIIRYNTWGNANIENRLWELLAPYTGELENYHGKEHLKKQCKENKWKFKVLRYCRNGKILVMENKI